ncbi:MAG: phosphotransferase [Tranquillimonas sp.]
MTAGAVRAHPAPGAGAAPPPSLAGALARRELLPDHVAWRRLSGGRTNELWLAREATDRGLVCKIYPPGHDTPLFPNRPRDEAAALAALRGSGLAPRPVARLALPEGPCLIYGYLPGRTGTADPGEAGGLLRRLHDLPPPPLPRRAASADALRRQGDAMLDGLTDRQAAAELRHRRPEPCETPGDAVPAVFLHGDPVPSNILSGPDGPALIDWQCPARGDPVLDLALFLSPAMQVLETGRPLSRRQEAAFFAAYGDPAAQRRLHRLAPVLHWRMAVYCQWRIERGDAAYRPALAAELARLDHVGQPDQHGHPAGAQGH